MEMEGALSGEYPTFSFSSTLPFGGAAAWWRGGVVAWNGMGEEG